MTETRMQRYFFKPATVGGIAYLGNSMFISGKKITLRGSEYPLAMVAAAAVAAGSLLAEISHDYVQPMVHTFDKLSEPVSLAVAAGVTGGGNVAAHYLLRGDGKSVAQLGPSNLFLLGALSEMVGDTVYARGILPTFQSLVY